MNKNKILSGRGRSLTEGVKWDWLGREVGGEGEGSGGKGEGSGDWEHPHPLSTPSGRANQQSRNAEKTN